MNGRVECKLILTICRYPDKKEDAQEVGAEIGDALTVALGSLEIDGRPRRPYRSQYAAKEDDTLEWEAEYRFHVLRKEKGIRMGSLTHHEELR